MKKKYLLLVLMMFLYSCESQKIKPKIQVDLENKNYPVQESWNSKIIFTDEGKLKAILYSKNIKVFENPREKLIDGLKVDFYNENEIKTSWLSSKRGKIDDVTENMFAYEDVIAKNDSSNVVLKTEELMWRRSDKKIVTNKFVTITSPDEVIQGYGMESDQNLKNYKVFDITYQTTIQK
ncbi:MAG: LPS export ABC transporter periplasmic protein LptC [Ignavibacteriales bacterium]